MNRSVAASVSILFLLAPVLASAMTFPDVPSDHPYNSAIEALAASGVVTGDPDGNFYPARPVNRAEFLTMLYRATKKSARAVSTSCFLDVKATAWYANVVCDAAAAGYVNGYPDGSFKPEQTVNRIEALKMIYKVFGYAVLTGADANFAATLFTDVQMGQWYTGYVTSSYRNGLLPIPGYTGTNFYPANPLLRGEAAAYVWRAMNITGDFQPLPGEGSSSSMSSSSSVSSTDTSSSASPVAAGTVTTQVDFPFSDGGNASGTKNFVYDFPLAKDDHIQIDASLVNGDDSGITCRLFLLGADGLSQEFYIGEQDASSCHMKLSVPAGSYQLEVHPGDTTAQYKVVTTEVKGDGNDGFNEAILLQPGKSKAGQLAVSDYADWFKFSLDADGQHEVQSFGPNVSCYIYPLSDVNLPDLTTPVCGEMYAYPKGSYIVRIQRADNTQSSLTYSVQLD